LSIVPEFILQSAITRGIKTMRADSRYVDQLFRTLSQGHLAQLRQFIKEQAIDLCINYPRDTLKVPAIVILLKAEDESQAFLGDEMGNVSHNDLPDGFSYDGAYPTVLGSGGVASVSKLTGGPGPVIFGPTAVVSSTNNTVKVVGEDIWDVDQLIAANQVCIVRIVKGTGAGQIRNVIANTGNVLMVSPNWVTNPDNTSVLVVTGGDSDVNGEPSSLYDRQSNTVLDRVGGIYGAQYQIQVIGPSPELTIYLSMILKSIFTILRQYLEAQGIINLKMSATDFLPRAEYAPDFAYMRAVNLSFLYHFDVWQDITPQLATSFVLSVENAIDDVVLSMTATT
jgi:hypothetical protein